jgi:putative nucleotidyltransferase with HDIG domain
MRRMRQSRSYGLSRPLTLLRAFLVVSAVILAVGAVALSSRLSSDLHTAVLEDSGRDVSAFVDAAVSPAVVHGGRVALTPGQRGRLASSLRLPDDVTGVNVYARNGRLVFSTTRPDRVGRVRLSPDLRRAIQSGEPSATELDPVGSAGTVVKVWAPLTTRAGSPVGAAQVSLDDSVVTAVTADARGTIWYAVGVVFGVLWLVLALLVRGASVRMRAQNEQLAAQQQDLVESSRELQATLLQTIETLNAAVEARDPYTAGHSQRVRRVSLAIGRELRLSPKQLGALATAALFHDIGKIGMPDSILTKPGRLEPAEAVIMREHVTRGAEIVSRISPLQDSVPAIRHHHERWDGLGYPDRLGGTAIPIEAAIIAIADAWDAMTTDRPYSAALDMSEAILQIHAGRGKQFNPAVVDAFVAVSHRRPAEILPPDAESSAVAV